MNLQNHPSDASPADEYLDDLLDQALSPDADLADLEQRVLALTDPSLNRLLDVALAPEQVPAGLTERVLAATAPATLHASSNRPVLARIGLHSARYAAAAAVVFAAGLGIYVVTSTQTTPGQNPNIASGGSDDTNQPTITYEQFADQFDPGIDLAIDQEIDQLDSRISSVNSGIWEGDIDSFQEQLWVELAGDEWNL